MKRLAILQYMFVFEPDQTWDSISSFETDLASFYAAHKKQMRIVETAGNSGFKVVHIESMDLLDKVTQPTKKFTPPSHVIKQLQHNAGKGYFKKRRR